MFNIKKAKKYKVTVTEVLDDNQLSNNTLEFQTESPEDILSIVEKLKQHPDFEGDDAATFGVGLKLFTSIMMKHKDNPMFQELMPAFKNFMKGLKQKR